MSCDNRRLVDNVPSRRYVDSLEINGFHRLGVRKSPKIELTPNSPEEVGSGGVSWGLHTTDFIDVEMR